MFPQLRENFWNRIHAKNKELNTNSNCEKISTGSETSSEWDLSRIELQDERRNRRTNIPTIDLESEDNGNVRTDLKSVSPLANHTSRVYMMSTNAQKTSSNAAAIMRATETHLGHRAAHEHLGVFAPRTSYEPTILPAPAGIIFNRVYNKKTISPKENYFSVLDTPPTPGVLSAAAIFGERSNNVGPTNERTSNHNEIIRRSFDKTTSLASHRIRRQEKRNGPYKLLGVIDLEPDDDSEVEEDFPTPSTAKNSPNLDLSAKHEPSTSTNSALLGGSVTPLSSKLCGGTDKADKNRILTIEIDEDEDVIDVEETRMDLSEADDETDVRKGVNIESGPGTSKTPSIDEQQVEQCSLSDSETSSTAQMNPSSLANSFWDVSSSGCIKKSSDNTSSANRKDKHTDFDLLLDRINQQVPAMSQQDRVNHWRVTREDLLYSIPSNAEIESNASIKRPMDDPIRISSSDSSDSETSDSPSLLLLKQQRGNCKKRRTGADSGDRSSSSLHLSEDLDFRKSQINPEIDKTGSMIQVRKNYHKFPTRFDRLQDETVSTVKCLDDPYGNFLNDDSEKEEFAKYLRRNPAYRPNLLKHRNDPISNENKVAVVVVSAIKELPSSESNVGNTFAQQQPERSESAERVPKYGKNRKKSAGKTIRYRVRKTQLKKKSIMVVPSNLRSYRRLIMKSSLRNGKVRKKSSFVNFLSSTEQKRRKRMTNQVSRKLTQQKQEQPLKDTKPTLESEPVQSCRVSVDSAVSSSTSADHTRRDGSDDDELLPLPVSSELLTMKNPLSRSNGDVLMVFYVSDNLIVVQQETVSFWKCSKLTAMLGLKQDLQLVGQIKRAQTDSEIDSMNTNRLGLNEDTPFYLEPRARNLDEDESRVCPLASIYINCYFADPSDVDKEEEQCIQMKSLQLDTVRSDLSDILFVPLPRSRYFMLCWYEQLSEVEHRTGLCKYSLTPDLETLASIREFPTTSSKLSSLKCLDNDRLIGLGSTTVSIWNYDNGYLLFTVDLKIDLHLSLTSFIRTENNDSALFLVQMCPPTGGSSKRKLIKVIGINMSKRSWHLIHSYEVMLESSSILCESSALNSASLHCTSFQSGELLAICLDDLTTCFTNHKQLQSADGKRITRDNMATREKIFLNSVESRQLVLISDKLVKLKSIEEYLLLHR